MKAERKKPSVFSNEKTSASAGSGKTHALVTRYIALAAKETNLLTGAPNPECIVALTFTRKAAGEFLRRILTRLAEACISKESAKDLISEVEKLYEVPENSEVPEGYAEKISKILDEKKIFAILRECVANLDKLNLSTIDSFCASIIFSHANELRIFAPLEMMDERSRKSAEIEVMDSVLQKGAADPASFVELAEAVKMASFGMEEKSIEKVLVTIIDECRDAYWENADISLWGDESFFGLSKNTVWNAANYAKELRELSRLAEENGLSKVLQGPIKFFEQSFGSRISTKAFPVALKRLAQAFVDGNLSEAIFLEYNRKTFEIPKEITKILNSLFEKLRDSNLRALCLASHALGKITRAYENEYDKSVRSKGKLVFGDIALLLSDKTRSLEKSLLEDRLDAKFKHWMFDEFQDTSERQWSVFENLVDEILVGAMDGESGRTLYYVGDVKQSLYSWRGGNSRLFDAIPQKYSRAEAGIFAIENGRELNVSWRSGENLINAINSFFENPNGLAAAFTSSSADRFLHSYTHHISAESEGLKTFPSSYAQLSVVENITGAQASQEKIAEEVFEILRRVNPPARGKSCAILLSDNEAVRFYVNYLSTRFADENENINIAGDIELPLCRENLIFPLFIQILRKISHPSDSASQVYISMTPFDSLFLRDESQIKNAMIEFAEGNFSDFSKKFAARILEKFPNLDEYSRIHLADLIEACAEFDNLDDRSIDACISFLSSKKVRTNPPEKMVQVMTIHKSKGLSFDTVILPELHKISARARGGMMTLEGGRVIQTPPKALAALDESLSQKAKAVSDDENFEAICKFYVALTRAESLLYVIIPELSKYEVSGEISKAQFIFEAFNPELLKGSPLERRKLFNDIKSIKTFSFGKEPKFSFASEPREVKGNAEFLTFAKIENPKVISGKFSKLTPSEKPQVAEKNDDARLLGIFIHAVLENLDTLDEANFDEVISKTKNKNRAFVKISARELERTKEILQKFSGNSEICEAFSQKFETYCEHPFTMLRGEALVSGVIDRIIFNRAQNSAIVYDFKLFADSAEKHARQMRLYKDAVSFLFGIPSENVCAKIVSCLDAKIFE